MIIVQLEVERSHQRIRQEKIDRRKSFTCACNMYSNGTASVLICFSPDYFSIRIDNLTAVSFRTSSTGDDDTSGIHKPACACCSHTVKDHRQSQNKYEYQVCGNAVNADVNGVRNVLAAGHVCLPVKEWCS